MKVYSDESDNLHYNIFYMMQRNTHNYNHLKEIRKVVQRNLYYKILLHFKEYYVLFIILFYLFK